MVEILLSLVLPILPTLRVVGGHGVDGLVSVLGSILTFFFLTNLAIRRAELSEKVCSQEVLI